MLSQDQLFVLQAMLVWLDDKAEAADGSPGQGQDEQPVCNVWIPRHAGNKKEEDEED